MDQSGGNPFNPYSVSEKKLIYGLEPSQYPTRLGQPWKEDEFVRLLTSIQKKKTVEEIAKEHDRTVGGINSYIRKLAVDYHFNDKRPMEDIQRFTGLTKEQIEDAIKKHELKETIKRSNEKLKEVTGSSETIPKKKKPTEKEIPTMLEVVTILKDIQTKLNTILEKVA